MNILLLSVGTRNKIVQYFKKELDGEGLVIATDASEFAPAIYEADRHYIVPKITEPNYIDVILDICKKNNVKGVLSLIDPELTLISENFDRFVEIGTLPIISSKELIALSFDKFEFSSFVKKLGFNPVNTYLNIKDFKKKLDIGEVSFPAFVKPKNGSASININVVSSLEQLLQLYEQTSDLIVQEYMNEKEYGVDVYIDLVSKKPVSIFIKEKLLMRAGETDKSVSIHNEELNKIIYDFVIKAGYQGIIDIDVFEKDNKFYISEVNPRFGGGYPHAYELGINIPKQIITNLAELENIEKFDYESNRYMMKYNEIFIK